MVKIGCFHPLKLFYTDSFIDADGNQKYRTRIVPYSTHHLEEDCFGNWWPVPVQEVGECRAVAYRHFDIPCGKCIGCRLDYSRTWANRLMLELKYHDPDKCWFVTLTYNNASVPIHYYSDPETGKLLRSLSLEKRDVQLFIKKLRRHIEPSLMRFYLAGEYGENTFRPHYHAILFNCPLDREKLVRWSTTDQGFTLWKSPELENIWSYGNVLVSPVSWLTCSYVARYVTKKLNGDAAEVYKTFNIVPPFSLMSRKPGIARQYFDDHPDVIEKGLHFAAGDKAVNCESPRYFRNLWKSLDNDLEAAIIAYEGSLKQDDKVHGIQLVNSLASQDYDEYLRLSEKSMLHAAATLKRSDN